MSIFTDLLTELRDKRLWPVAAALVLALVAMPLLLSKSSPAPASPPPPVTPAAPAGAVAIPSVEVAALPLHHRLAGRAHNPFRQPGGGVHKLGVSPSVSGAGAGVATPKPSSGSRPSSTAGSGASTVRGGARAPAVTPTPVTIPVRKTIRPAPAGLTPRQSYDVKLAVTLASGGLRTFDSLERLSALPSRQLPLLVELGVMKGARRVLFAVEPGVAVSGPGTCLPGPVDCELLSLAESQIETLSSARIPSAAQFAVTGITASRHPSAAAAERARARSSTFGARLLRQASLSILSLFPYDVRNGTVEDHRSLTVGGK